MDTVIDITGLSKEYETGFWRKKKVRALDGLSLSVTRGQIFGFLGGNGAGKTTTIKILMSLIFPSGGSAKIFGHDISDFRMHRRIGYSPENPYFYDYLTPRELLLYFAEIFAIDRNIARTRVDELLAQVGLDEKDRNKQMRKFSKGMMQRVSIAQSLINDPELVVLDEPMSGLDPIGRREIRELIAGLRDKGKTVFMSTHILTDVETLCDEVAIMRKGKLAATGKLDDLLRTNETDSFEVQVEGIAGFPQDFQQKHSVSVQRVHPAAVLRVEGERNVTEVLRFAQENGGRLLSVHPIRRSLEDLFTDES